MRKLKLYLETSVWSHYYANDVPSQMNDTKTLFELIREQGHRIYISRFVATEIEKAEECKKIQLRDLIDNYKPGELEATPKAYKLADKYIKSAALPRNSHTDAMHASITTIYNLDMLVSWNYKHLTSPAQKNKINMANIRYGHRPILIFTPTEVMQYAKS